LKSCEKKITLHVAIFWKPCAQRLVLLKLSLPYNLEHSTLEISLSLAQLRFATGPGSSALTFDFSMKHKFLIFTVSGFSPAANGDVGVVQFALDGALPGQANRLDVR
jgi:hypothetical protein